ncbi:MAG: hypothetical protein AAFZ09_02810 [Pseudomonadota bacterium]
MRALIALSATAILLAACAPTQTAELSCKSGRVVKAADASGACPPGTKAVNPLLVGPGSAFQKSRRGGPG